MVSSIKFTAIAGDMLQYGFRALDVDVSSKLTIYCEGLRGILKILSTPAFRLCKPETAFFQEAGSHVPNSLKCIYPKNRLPPLFIIVNPPPKKKEKREYSERAKLL